MKTLINFAVGPLLLVTLAACGHSDGSKPANQIAVKVNGEEITVHQLNEALARMGPAANMPPDRVRAMALDRLVDQQLAIQKAKESKLDRDSNVLTIIENNRRSILSQAYFEKVASSAATPSAAEIHEYYVAHPELFAKRRIYRFQEIAAGVNDDQRTRLEARMKSAKNFNELATWMREQQIPFNADFSLKAAEQLPMGTLPRFQAMKPGEIATFPSTGRILLVQLVAAQEAPMTEKDAEPFITRYLNGQKRSEVAARELKQMRTSAKLEFMGDFAKEKSAAVPVPQEKTVSTSKEASKLENGSLDKALSGLK